MLQTRLVSHYQLIKILGKGAFGTTYLARDIYLPGSPEYAIKKLNPNTQDKNLLEVARRLFKTEARALQKLGQHSQIPRLVANFEQNRRFYIVQEFIAGHSLKRELVTGEAWSEERVVQMLEDCLKILKFIHDRGVIHRDIKPNNFIRRQEDNKLVLIDFGAVKQAIGQNQTLHTIGIGTRGYMPPEQAMGKPRFSSDIYGLGVIALQALTGLKPKDFQKDDNGEIIWLHQTKDININPKLVRIINKMIRLDFQERYNCAEMILQDLNHLHRNIFFLWPDRSFSSNPINLSYNQGGFLIGEEENYFNNKTSTNNSKLKFIVAISMVILGAIATLIGINFQERHERKHIDRPGIFNAFVLTK